MSSSTTNLAIDAPTGVINQQTWPTLFPAEILSQIFHLVVIPPHDEYGRTIYQTANTPWSQLNRLRLVCRSWRFAALTSRVLWSYVYNPSTNFMVQTLSRSGSSPLMLALTDVDQVLLGEELSAPRLRELRLHISRDLGLQAKLMNKLRSTPLLTSLTIVVPRKKASWLDTPCLVAMEFLIEPRPSLQHLVLRDCPLPRIQFPIFDRLRYFSFTLQEDDIMMPPNISLVLRILKQMPNLEYLYLYIAGSDDLFEVEQEPINLPSLATIELTMSVGHCRELLSAIRMPNIRKEFHTLHFDMAQHLYDTDDALNNLDAVFNTMGITPDSIIPPRLFSHGAVSAATNCAQLKLWNSPIAGIPESGPPDDCPIQVYIEDDGLAMGAMDLGIIGILESLVIFLPHKMEHLALTHRTYASSFFLPTQLCTKYLEFFQNSCFVKTLHFRSTGFPQGLFEVMCHPFSDVPPLASLERITFVDVDFGAETAWMFVSQVGAYVKYRVGHEMGGLKEVRFVRCGNLEEGLVGTLRRMVRDCGVEIVVTPA